MPPQPQGSGGDGLPKLKALLVLLAMALATYILGPPLYWRFVEGSGASVKQKTISYCAECVCDCTSSETGDGLPPGFSDDFEDCAKYDSHMQNELDKNAIELLSEELKLQSIVADENQRKSDKGLLEVKKLSSQYQKEAEKCNFGMETCEGGREKAEAALAAQKKVRDLWEQRARDLGWKSE